jgi:hypothetical protein
LKSLLDIPIKISKVDGTFLCDNNQLTSLEGAPKEVGGDFNCAKNPGPGSDGKGFTEEDVKDVSNVKGKILV